MVDTARCARLMELKLLRHFVAVVDEENLSRAAKTLHITQPALTRSIKNLESLVQAELLDRLPRGVAPTEAGRALYRSAKRILNQTDRAVVEVAEIAAGTRGHVDIGVAALFARDIIDDVVVQLAKSTPSLSLTITEGFFEEQAPAVSEGRLDVALTNFPPTAMPTGLTSEPLLDLTSWFVVGCEHSLAGKDEISLQDLFHSRWAVVNQRHMTDLLDQFFASEGLPTLKGAVHSNSLNTLRALVLSNEFVSLLPEHFIRRDLVAGKIARLRVDGTPMQRKGGLIYRSSPEPRAAVARFIDAVRESAEAFAKSMA